ncbi:MAG: RidA family protein [Halioglobus sp.]
MSPNSNPALAVGLLSALLMAIALASNSAMAENPRMYPSAKHPEYPFSEAVAYNEVLYLSGEIGADKSGQLVPGGIGPETKQVMNNIKATLARHQLDMSDIIKCTVFLADIAQWPTFNRVYAGYFNKGKYPARSALAASGLALGAAVEVECLAALN